VVIGWIVALIRLFAIALVVIFQAELAAGLGELGTPDFSLTSRKPRKRQELAEAVTQWINKQSASSSPIERDTSISQGL